MLCDKIGKNGMEKENMAGKREARREEKAQTQNTNIMGLKCSGLKKKKTRALKMSKRDHKEAVLLFASHLQHGTP